jgi:hypothetical protein
MHLDLVKCECVEQAGVFDLIEKRVALQHHLAEQFSVADGASRTRQERQRGGTRFAVWGQSDGLSESADGGSAEAGLSQFVAVHPQGLGVERAVFEVTGYLQTFAVQ